MESRLHVCLTPMEEMWQAVDLAGDFMWLWTNWAYVMTTMTSFDFNAFFFESWLGKANDLLSFEE